MNGILVWVLIVSSLNSSAKMAEMMGPFHDKESCQRVQSSKPLKQISSQCIQVRVPNNGKGIKDDI